MKTIVEYLQKKPIVKKNSDEFPVVKSKREVNERWIKLTSIEEFDELFNYDDRINTWGRVKAIRERIVDEKVFANNYVIVQPYYSTGLTTKSAISWNLYKTNCNEYVETGEYVSIENFTVEYWKKNYNKT